MKKSDIVGIQGRAKISCRKRCGQIFKTRDEDKEICSKCTSYLNALASRKKDIHRPRKGISQPERLSIVQISKLAAERHMSYGEFVSKYGTVDPIGELLKEEHKYD